MAISTFLPISTPFSERPKTYLRQTQICRKSGRKPAAYIAAINAANAPRTGQPMSRLILPV
jgi:hypothetical protein